MPAEDRNSILDQKLAQGAVRHFAVRIAAPATGAASEIALCDLMPAAVGTTAGVDNPNTVKVLRVEYIADVAVASAGGSAYGTLTIGTRNPATGGTLVALTGSKDNQVGWAAFVAQAIVSTAQAVAAGQVLTLINTPTSTGGAWQAGTIVIYVQE